MAEDKVFTTRETLDNWNLQEHTPRSRCAWESGVSYAVRGRRPDLYDDSPGDYRRAFLGGYQEALRRLADGDGWSCGECQAVHRRDERGLHAVAPSRPSSEETDTEDE